MQQTLGSTLYLSLTSSWFPCSVIRLVDLMLGSHTVTRRYVSVVAISSILYFGRWIIQGALPLLTTWAHFRSTALQWWPRTHPHTHIVATTGTAVPWVHWRPSGKAAKVSWAAVGGCLKDAVWSRPRPIRRLSLSLSLSRYPSRRRSRRVCSWNIRLKSSSAGKNENV